MTQRRSVLRRRHHTERRYTELPKESSGSVRLSKDQLKIISETAAAAAIAEYRKEIERDREERRDKRLYNTRLLMEKYRGMVEYAEDAIYDAIQLDEDFQLQSLMELMDTKGDDGVLSVESIRARAVRTRIILTHVNKMLDFYRFRCQNSGKKEIERKWTVIQYLYVDEEEKTVTELAAQFGVDERTIYRYNKAALTDLCALFFGSID